MFLACDAMLSQYTMSSNVHPSVTSPSSTKMVKPRITQTTSYNAQGF